MSLDFLTPRVERLSAGGEWKVEHVGGAIGRLRTPVVLLARDMTAHSRFEASGLPRSRRRQAARLHARAASPYLEGAYLLAPAKGDFGVWWWDAERTSARVQARFPGLRPKIRPETLAQPVGQGWRIVALSEGYEAQFWRDGALRASVWRREKFDTAAWAAFTRAQRDAGDAPSAPPPAQRLPIDWDAPAFNLSTVDFTREQVLGGVAAGLALFAVCLTLFLTGQGLRLKSDAAELQTQTDEILALAPSGGQTLAGLEGDQKLLAAYRQVEERTNPLSAAGAAIGILALYDLVPTAVQTGDEEISLTLPYAALTQIDPVISEIAGSGYFYEVRPRTDAAGQRLIIDMKVRSAAPPIGAVSP